MSKKKSLFYVSIEYVIAILVGYYVYQYNIGTVHQFIAVLYADVVMTVIIFIFSVIHDNSSVYDPYWSVIPVVAVLLWMVFYNSFGLSHILALTGVLVWSIRLTSNWLRDYPGFVKEDFRYVEFRNRFKQYYWIVSFLGIHLFPTLIVLIALYPIYYVISTPITAPLFIYLGSIIMMGAALLSFVADEQVRNFKKNPINKKLACDTGLWKHSRHPNYLGELTFWFGVMILSFGSGFQLANYVGFVSMVLLFNLYSIPKMEEKLLKGKLNYEQVMETVPHIIPVKLKD